MQSIKVRFKQGEMMTASLNKFYGKMWDGFCLITAKCEMAFCLNTGKRFLVEVFILKPIERLYVSLKNGTKDFEYIPPFKTSACFYVTINGDFS